MRDPWRVDDPIRAPAGGKVDLSTKDFDADWRPTRACMLRFRACSIEVAGIYLSRPADALAGLARCVIAIKRATAGKMLASIYARTEDDDSGDRSPDQTAAARLSCGDTVLEFAGIALDHGALALVRALIAAGRDPRLAPILRDHGVTPMLRTT